MNAQQLRTWGFVGVLAAAVAARGAEAGADAAGPLARQILEATGVRGGLVVHVGCGDGKLTTALHANDSYLVHGLDRQAQNVEAARAYVQSLGLYGPVSVETWTGKDLPYIDNLVNLVVLEDPNGVSQDELLRVLAPGGVAYTRSGDRWAKLVKPWPKEIDEWTHYLHDSTNNAVAHDSLIEPPRRYQWVGGERYSRQHDHMSSVNAVVSAAGRVFCIFDEAPRASILIPPQWRLIARDAFNGTLLWKRKVSPWHEHLWPLKSGPQLMTRRLVAVGDRVYVTLGTDAPLVALDAATGQTVRTYEGTQATEEILYQGGVLFLSVAKSGEPLRSDPKRVFANLAEIRAAVTDPLWTDAPRTIMAVDAESGKVLWEKESEVVSMSLAADGQRVLFHDGEKIQCLDRATGEVRWASEPLPRREHMRSSSGVTLVIYGDVILYSGLIPAEEGQGRSTMMYAVSAEDGKTLWKAEHPPCGHMGTPDDLLVTGGLVWSGAVAQGTDSGVMIGRDLHSGEVKSEFLPDVETYWFHHRCYRAKATDKYLLFSRTGIEFIDYAKQHWICNHWVRGACLYGVMPCNGLIYAPQHPCACYLEAKLYGFSALAPPSKHGEPRREVPDEERLQPGPSFGPLPPPFNISSDWPTYRHDPARSGATKTTVEPNGLKQCWEARLGGKLTSPVVAEGKLFVASVDSHAVHALDASTGKPVWSFTAGGRVDSPPTIWEGRVLFGSADGHVYCVRASDGQLVWRYRAAPEDRRMGAFDQIESVWPVHGSVLVEKGVLYCAAGRSMFLDGGLRFLRLDPKSGRKLSETILDDRDPETKESLQTQIRGLNMPVALPDILSSDGNYVYMRSLPFDLEGNRKFVSYVEVKDQQGDDVHLFSPTGFLDDTLWHRTYWVYGRAFASGAGGYYQAGRLTPAGRILVFDDDKVYGYGRLWRYYRWTTPLEFDLFAADKQPEIVRAGIERTPVRKAGKATGQSRAVPVTRFMPAWSDDAPVQVTSMVLAGGVLFAAGPPDVEDEEQSAKTLSDPETQKKLAEQSAAFQGRLGAVLIAVSPSDGQKLAAYRLESMPRFDGMIAAGARLYLSTVDGKVLCLGGGEGPNVPAAADVPVTAHPEEKPLEETPGEAAAPPASVVSLNLPSAAEDFAKLTGGQVYRSDLGYLLASAGDSRSAYALKRLPEPLTGKATFKVEMNMAPAGAPAKGPRNGFLVFGANPNANALVHCGILQKQNKAVVIEGSGKQAKRAEETVTADAKVTLEVSVDPAAGQVTLSVGGKTVALTLDRPVKSIAYVGYGVQSAVTEFGPVEN
jgi:outer membrane protein assembly factor BamB